MERGSDAAFDHLGFQGPNPYRTTVVAGRADEMFKAMAPHGAVTVAGVDPDLEQLSFHYRNGLYGPSTLDPNAKARQWL